MDRLPPIVRRLRLEFVVPLVLGMLVVWGLVAAGSSGGERGPFTVPVQRGAVAATVSADGQVESPQELSLNFEGSGRLVEVLVREGSRVSRGQVLARIENASPRAGLGSAEANLSAARARLTETSTGLTPIELSAQTRQADEARIAARNAQRDLADARRVAGANVSGLRRAAARARVVGEEADLRASELRLAQEQAQVDLLRQRYDRFREAATADRRELYEQRDRLRDAQNRQPPDETEINNASFRIDVLESKIATEQSDEASARADLITATANVRGYVQEVDRNRIALREARRRQGDATDLLRNGAASARQQVDSARAALSTSQAQLQTTLARNRVDQQVKAADLASGIANVAQAQALLQDARKAVEDTVLRAPTAGVVGNINAKVGELTGGALRAPGASGLAGGAAAGGQAPRAGAPGAGGAAGAGLGSSEPLITLAQTRDLQVKVNFSEIDAANLHTGDPARVTVDAFPGRRFAARVASIDPIATVQGNVVTYEVTLVLDDTRAEVRPGMSATADVEVARADDVLTVPRTAVRSPQGANPSVTVVLPGGRQELRQVATGLQSNTSVQVLAGVGLGERVVRTISPPPDAG